MRLIQRYNIITVMGMWCLPVMNTGRKYLKCHLCTQNAKLDNIVVTILMDTKVKSCPT